jgi:chemotaxis protein methyltransferase CheR
MSIATAFDRIHHYLESSGAGSARLLKPGYVERRLRIRYRAVGVTGPEGYAEYLDRDPEERARLAATVTLGVTSFFRDPTLWHWLAGALAVSPPGRWRGWSAGTATGEEAWSLASVFAAVADQRGLDDWRVLGTDIDEAHLEAARRGQYPGRPVPAYADHVSFERDDLTEARSRGPFEVVLCRNVMIYFGPEGQRRILESVASALAPGGLLVLGKAEFLPSDGKYDLVLVDRAERVYRRSA